MSKVKESTGFSGPMSAGIVAGVEAPRRELAKPRAVGVDHVQRPPVGGLGHLEVHHLEHELLPVR